MLELEKNKKNTAKNTFLFFIVGLIFSAVLTFLSVSTLSGVSFIAENVAKTVALWVVLLVIVLMMFLSVRHTNGSQESKFKQNLIICTTVFISSAVAWLFIRFLSYFAISISITAILTTLMLNKRLGLVAIMSNILLVLAPSITVLQGSAVVQVMIASCFSIISASAMVIIISTARTRFKLVWGCVVVAIAKFPLVAIASLISVTTLRASLFAGMWASVAGLSTIFIAVAILPIYEKVFNVWTNFKMAEECSFSRPLLRELAEKAPGSFNHCLVVGNLAECCAIAIGENPFLARICAYYHDIGKIENPEYFVENQKGYNPHDDLIPEVSVEMITSHTKHGYEILRKYGVPENIAKITYEHHGTSPVTYFYLKAQNITEGELRVDEYCYDNPKPSTKIAAIIMLADIIEAATRSINVDSYDQLKAYVDKLVKDRLDFGQFNDCAITMEDLRKIKETVMRILPAINHKRISYPSQKQTENK